MPTTRRSNPAQASQPTQRTVDETTSPSQPDEEHLDDEIQASHDRIEKLQKLHALRQTIVRLEAEVGNQGNASPTNSRRRSRSPSTEHNKEIAIKNIPNFSLDFTLQKRQEWLLDLEYSFRGAPKKYDTEARQILAAIGKMDPVCRYRWIRHVREQSEERQRDIESSWSYFQDWTLSLIQDATTIEATTMTQLSRLYQAEDQDPREFHAHLDSLEQNFPRQDEKQRALFFFSKLTSSLRRYIQEHVIHLPTNRDEIVSLATHFWNLSKPDRKRKAEGPPSEHAPSKRSRGSFRGFQRGQRGGPNRSSNNQQNDSDTNHSARTHRNPIGRDGKPLRCYTCNSEEHLSPDCRKQDTSVQSASQRTRSQKDLGNAHESK